MFNYIHKRFELNHAGSVTFIFFIIIAIAISEYIFAFENLTYGIVLSLFITLAIYIFISVIDMNPEIVKSAESLALIPLYVLFTSSLPWFFINQQYLLPAVYSIILALCFWHIYEHDIDVKNMFYLTGSPIKFLITGAVIAIPTGIIEYLILLPKPAFPSFEIGYLLRDIIYMLFFVSLAEELLFRGIILNDLTNVFGWKTAILAQGILFGIMHMTWRSSYEIIFTASAGVFLGYFYYRTRSLIGPIVWHAANNVLLVAVLPYFYPFPGVWFA